ncbi:hypothetical protein V5O48_000421 [Marasmius crinis-equi]|uniref:Uncharacterized protein n=1 Tax=Marasmius crinis-equi TaxID=585013 RepID=A0ABR3G184_9AGAR
MEADEQPSELPPSSPSPTDIREAVEWGTRSEPLLQSPTTVAPEQPRAERTSPSPTHTRSRTGTHGHGHHRPPLSPPLPSVSALAGAGFQIGLSPVSPGFTILPLERRRRVSNLGVTTEGGVGDSPVSGSGSGIGIGRPSRSGGRGAERRRTVSEGDMGGRGANLVPGHATTASEHTAVEGAGSSNEPGQQERSISENAERRGNGAWTWFRRKAQR